MNLSSRIGALAVLGALSLAVVLGGAVSPVFAHNVTGCVVAPTSTITMFAGGSAVLKVTITYNSFGSGDWPMTVTVNPISSGFSSNSSSFTDSSAGTHTFYLKITNTNTATTTGTGTISVVWKAGSSALCGNINLKNVGFPPPVPEFPFGLALVMAAAVPVLLLVKGKRSAFKTA